MNYQEGSIWRRCDLHVHTPESHLNNQFGDNWDNYVKELIKKAIEKEIYIVGITDYFTIDGYKKLKKEYLDNNDKLKSLFQNDSEILSKLKNILFLPNIEFRLDQTVNGNRINFHVIFSDKLDIEEIEENFLYDVKFTNNGNLFGQNESLSLTKRNIKKLGKRLKEQQDNFSGSDIKVGMNCATVNDNEIMKILKNNNNFKNKYLIATPSDEDLSELSWNGQSHMIRKSLIQKSNILFASNKNTINWGLGLFNESEEDYIDEFNSLKPCVHGSDAHSLEELFEPDEERYCWIKSDSTFEGLRQLIYEPRERVLISKNNPNYMYEKPFFKSIKLNNDIGLFDGEELFIKKNEEIKLNKNLSAIIGGRGSGKSIFINVIANVFNQSKIKDLKKSNDLCITYSKNNTENSEIIDYIGSENNSLDFLFISQGDLYELVSDRKKLSNEIKKLLRIDENNFPQELQDKIDDVNNNIDISQKWFNKEDEEGNLINSKEYNKIIISRNKDLISSITTRNNKEKLEKYTENTDILLKIKEENKKLIDLKDNLESYQKEVNKKIEEMSSINKLTEINFEIQYSEINKYLEDNKKNSKLISDNNKEIREDFLDIYKGDLNTLLSNADKYKQLISNAKNKIKNIELKEAELEEKLKERVRISKDIYRIYNKQKEDIDEKWKSIGENFSKNEHKELIKKILSDRNIEIYGEIVFDKDIFIEDLKDTLNLVQYRNSSNASQEDKIFSDISINDVESYFDFLENDFNTMVEKDDKIKSIPEFINLFFNLSNRNKYLYTIPIIKYKGKRIEKLSAGQKGTVYLCIKLATNAFSTPIIFDQPEDDLDNEFIIEELVSIIKELKKYRQIIIVTHNANLAINADAEQIIVASNDDEELTYYPGAIENSNIIGEVCKILEGGKIAFENRNNKYIQVKR